ncbi:mitochondrial inner membrane protein Mitofilin [Schizophyllum amplum]|uniref:MICOS complex subunit MIC60 n=1 Tax=Schizophyllum amplum TaxID=97359 RepID=A0A550CAI3_9AGAR|nr:mitochondrial inner membrane protein Mitofilin [Auriculariopsis ampla]
MYRALSRHAIVPSTGRNAVRVTRRRIANDASGVTKKKKGIVRRVLFWSTLTTTGYYVGSTFVAFNSQVYYDFFSENVPLGSSLLDFAESHGWDTLTLEGIKLSALSAQQSIMDVRRLERAKSTAEATRQVMTQKLREAKDATVHSLEDGKAKATGAAKSVKKAGQEAAGKAQEAVKHQEERASDELKDLIQKAEAALGDTASARAKKSGEVSPLSTASSKVADPSLSASDIYDAPLPIGCEPPPGYKRPPPPKPKEEPKAEEPPVPELPRLTPQIDASEPVVAHLAGIIDQLATFVSQNADTNAKATPVLDIAKDDLTALVKKISQVKEEEQANLERRLDEQSREYSTRMLELEMQSQDKLDMQEDDFRKFYDEEKMRLAQTCREKLENELKVQTELINERLKEEVIAQGIELQRRWIRAVKMQVEEERGGRLAKIDEISKELKSLERVAIDNSLYLDENLRVHAFWSAFRTLAQSAVDAPVRKPFREELRVLRSIAIAREDPVAGTVLEILENGTVADVGVEPLADLTVWFTKEVSPKVSEVALVPEYNAGLLTFLGSRIFSALMFDKRGGKTPVAGDDVLSTLKRAEWYLAEKDLDSAAREVNQLRGPAAMLVEDWLQAARRRLEVEQALSIVQTQATLASLLVV